MTHVEPALSMMASGIMRPNNVREANASAVLRLLLRDGPVPRAEISQKLGLTQGPVTRIVAELAELGLVREGEPLSGRTRGRPRVPVELAPESRLSIGVHIGVRFINAALMDLRGAEIQTMQARHDGSVDGVVNDCARLVLALSSLADKPPLGVGVIIGGWVEPTRGRVRRHQLLDWRDVDLAELLSQKTGMEILVESSIRAHALADLIFGDARGHSSFAHIFVGHVVEASLVLDGRVHTSPEGIGGSLENWTLEGEDGRAAPAWEVIGDGTLTAKAREEGLISPAATFEDLVAVAECKSAAGRRAVEILNQRAFRVGKLIGAVTDLLGLGLVIISSGAIAQYGAIEHVQRGLEAARRGLPYPELRTVVNSGDILLRAAYSVVLNATLLSGRDME